MLEAFDFVSVDCAYLAYLRSAGVSLPPAGLEQQSIPLFCGKLLVVNETPYYAPLLSLAARPADGRTLESWALGGMIPLPTALVTAIPAAELPAQLCNRLETYQINAGLIRTVALRVYSIDLTLSPRQAEKTVCHFLRLEDLYSQYCRAHDLSPLQKKPAPETPGESLQERCLEAKRKSFQLRGLPGGGSQAPKSLLQKIR